MASDPKKSDGGPNYRVEALAKGLLILSSFSEQRTSLRLSDLAAETGIPLPTMYRLTMTLVSEGYIEQMPDGNYRPSVNVLKLGFAALRGIDLVELASHPLGRLASKTGETVNLGVLSADKVLYLIRLRNADLVTANIQVGSTLPAVYTSMGKLLLAFLTDDDLRDRVTSASFVRGAGPRAVSSLDALRPTLNDTRRRGWAVQDEELANGLRSVAAPIRNDKGDVIAAANIAVLASEWPIKRLESKLLPQLLDTCDEISRLLGHR